MREIVRDAGDRLRVRPEPREWSVIECIGHLVDSELVASARMRWILVEDEPDIVGYDQDRWVDGLRHRDDDPEDLIALFEALRNANLRLWAATPPADRERFGRHRERGPESYGLIVQLAAGHDRFHIAQAERALAGGPRRLAQTTGWLGSAVARDALNEATAAGLSGTAGSIGFDRRRDDRGDRLDHPERRGQVVQRKDLPSQG